MPERYRGEKSNQFAELQKIFGNNELISLMSDFFPVVSLTLTTSFQITSFLISLFLLLIALCLEKSI